MENNIDKIIDRVKQMNQDELVELNRILDGLESHLSDLAASKEQAREDS